MMGASEAVLKAARGCLIKSFNGTLFLSVGILVSSQLTDVTVRHTDRQRRHFMPTLIRMKRTVVGDEN